MPASAATKNTPPSTTSADEQGEVTKPTFQHAPISPSTATTNSNPVPNAESSTSPSPPSKKDFDNKKRTIKIPSVFIAIFATPLHFFHPTKSPVILSRTIFLINPYIFISLGFTGLNTEYKVLSNYGGELDIGFIARENENPSYGEIGERIEAAKMLKTGDSLDIIEDGGGNYLFCANNIPVAKTAKNFKEKIPKHARAAVAAVGVLYREDIGEAYIKQYRENIPAWAVVIPVLMIPQEP